MAITIGANLTADITTVRAKLEPTEDGTTYQKSCPNPPHAEGARIADVLRKLTDLIDSGTLTATAGTATSVSDTGAFTTVNSLIGCKVTFDGNVTAALADVEAYVISNTVNALTFAIGALPDTPAAGDTFVLEFTAIDSDLDVLDQGRGLGAGGAGIYQNGPTMLNAMMKLLERIGTVPAYMVAAAAEPFGFCSPYGGGNGALGTGGGSLISAGIEACRAAVAAYTAPA
jgi:hypothetical protein